MKLLIVCFLICGAGFVSCSWKKEESLRFHFCLSVRIACYQIGIDIHEVFRKTITKIKTAIQKKEIERDVGVSYIKFLKQAQKYPRKIICKKTSRFCRQSFCKNFSRVCSKDAAKDELEWFIDQRVKVKREFYKAFNRYIPHHWRDGYFKKHPTKFCKMMEYQC